MEIVAGMTELMRRFTRAIAEGCVALRVGSGGEGIAAGGSGGPTNGPGWREPGEKGQNDR